MYPNYHEWVDNILQLSDLRKFKFSGTGSVKTKHKSSKQRSEVEELKALV